MSLCAKHPVHKDPKDTILLEKSIILITTHKIANKNIKGIKPEK